jgi:hypothetical protein
MRNTQFAGFAKALYEDFIQLRENESAAIETIDQTYEEVWREKVEHLIAQRAYDLACHVFDNTSSYMVDCMEAEEAVIGIPDLTELPEVPK